MSEQEKRVTKWKGEKPLSEMRVRQLLDTLFDQLNRAHGGDYYNRFKEIAKERGRKIESSHFSKLDTVSMQLLIETIETLSQKKDDCCTQACGATCPLLKEG